MRRRQEWAKNPPPTVQTDVEPLNESTLPPEAPRRRACYVDPGEVSKHWDRVAVVEPPEEEEAPPQEAAPEKKRPGRPRKDKQAP